MLFNTNTRNESGSDKKFDLETLVLVIGFLVSTAGLFLSTDAFAGEPAMSSQHVDTTQLASAANNRSNHASKPAHDSASGSTSSARRDNQKDSDNQLGGYSLEDGAMRGAYGDGEYAD